MLGSELAKKRKVNKLRVEQLLAEAVAEYSPDTLELRDACRYLAATKERLEAERLGSPEHQRLMKDWADLNARLREARDAGAAVASHDLASATTDQLVAHTSKLLRRLLEVRDNEARRTETSPTLADQVGTDDGPAYAEHASAEPVGPRASATPSAPVCPFCMRPCIGREHSAYSVLHWDDPAEVVRRPLEAQRPGSMTEPEQPLETHEQQRQRAIRQNLGWEVPGGTLKT
jgi:hypothetical protein